MSKKLFQMFSSIECWSLDKPDEDITRYFDETAEYIHEILSKGERVLVHCFAGKSRSTTIMISYLIKYHKMTVDQALKTIREKRSVAQPNMGFLKQLRLYEKKILEGTPEVQAEKKILETAPEVQGERKTLESAPEVQAETSA